ncbi:cytochrome b [Phenylobacterium sp. LjRoot219]|uniref:cytochrome b n=1 Tax=Phenylobacterium sp. LjRoot219 TaxID=3342283 RepID=UPI003ED02560
MARFRRSAERYSAVAATLHWLLAGLLVFQLGLGAWMVGLPLGLQKYQLFQLHKSLGILILLLSLMRLGWRLAVPPPPLAAWLKPWERTAARAVHWALYGFMVGTPLLGWAAISAAPGPAPTRFFGLFLWPALPIVDGAGKAWQDALGSAHGVFAWTGAALIVVHVAGALKHQFIDRTPELQRMLPFLR